MWAVALVSKESNGVVMLHTSSRPADTCSPARPPAALPHHQGPCSTTPTLSHAPTH